MPPFTPENDEGDGRRQFMAAILFVGLALSSLYLPVESRERIAASLRSTVLLPFILTQETLAQSRVRSHEAERMRVRFDSVVAVLSSQTTLAEENARLRALLDLSSRATPEYRAANVIRPGTRGSESMYMLDVGARAGVRVNAPVVDRDGLVGVVRQVQAGTALAVDWTHPDFRVSAMTVDGENYGVVEPRRGEFREGDRLLLNGAPYHTVLEEGTLVVTSGLGGIYPRGIPLGRVHSLAEADAGWRKSYWIEPAVRPGSVTHVLVAVERGEERSIGESSGVPREGGDERAFVDRSHLWHPDSIAAPRAADALFAPLDSLPVFVGGGG